MARVQVSLSAEPTPLVVEKVPDPGPRGWLGQPVAGSVDRHRTERVAGGLQFHVGLLARIDIRPPHVKVPIVPAPDEAADINVGSREVG